MSGFALEEFTDINRPLERNAMQCNEEVSKGLAYCCESNRDQVVNIWIVSPVRGAAFSLGPGYFRKAYGIVGP